MTKVYDDATVLTRLTDFVSAHGYRSAAKLLGVDPGHLNRMRHGKSDVSDKVLAGLGLVRVVVAAPRSATPTRTGAR